MEKRPFGINLNVYHKRGIGHTELTAISLENLVTQIVSTTNGCDMTPEYPFNTPYRILEGSFVDKLLHRQVIETLNENERDVYISEMLSLVTSDFQTVLGPSTLANIIKHIQVIARKV